MRLTRTLLAAAASLFLASSAQAALTPDEAKLYEAAKQEGTLTWYVGAPLEGMQAIAKVFQEKYPGVNIQMMRMVGVAQYQRFMDETGAKKYIADVLQNTWSMTGIFLRIRCQHQIVFRHNSESAISPIRNTPPPTASSTTSIS